MATIKSFLVQYNPINQSNTFTGGDSITGQVILDLGSGCEITSISVKLKGKAKTKWKEKGGSVTVMYHDEEKYFDIQQFIIESGEGSLVEGGYHAYPFTFTIPAQDLPFSFQGKHGKIEYKLEAVLSRILKFNTKAQACLTILPKDPGPLPLETPQSGTVEKKMKLFASGSVSMDVNVDRSSLHPGEAITAVASVYNKSSRQVRLKYCIVNKISYFENKHKTKEIKVILKEVGESIPPSSGLTATKLVTIPPTTSPSILNCRIIKSKYKLKVYLDIKYASDPEVKFPIVVLPPSEEAGDDFISPNPFSYGAFGSYQPLDDSQRKS